VEALRRARLARAAKSLNRGHELPAFVLLTDDERLPDPLAAAHALPRGSMVVVRARQSSHRAKLARVLQPVARARGLVLLIANDPPLVDRIRAAGLHLPELNMAGAAYWRARRPQWLITAAAHSLNACCAAHRFRADAVFLSPVLPTKSHRDGRSLGPLKARRIASLAPLPVYALGGIANPNAGRLAESRFIGLAAIGALAVSARCTN